MNFFLKTDGLQIFSLNGTAVFEFNSEKTKNAISFSMANTLAECIKKDGATPSFSNWLNNEKCGVIVLKSNLDTVFVSGGDVKELNACDPSLAAVYASRMREFCIGLSRLEIPSVTLLTGGAFGGGAELALATDFRFISSKASLHFWQSHWGVPGGWNGMLRLGELAQLSPRKVGILFACAASLDANAMIRLGLVDLSFECVSEGFAAAEKLGAQFLLCDVNLRLALMRRGNLPTPLQESDTALFTQFWMGSLHKTKLMSFQDRRSKKT